MSQDQIGEWSEIWRVGAADASETTAAYLQGLSHGDLSHLDGAVVQEALSAARISTSRDVRPHRQFRRTSRSAHNHAPTRRSTMSQGARKRVAIVGAGGIAQSHVRAAKELADRVDVVAVVEVDPARRAWFATQHGITAATTTWA